MTGHPIRGLKDRRHPLVMALLVAMLAGCAAEAPQRQGMDLLREGRYEEGLAMLEQEMKETPRDLTLRADYIRERDRVIAILLASGEQAVAQGQVDVASAYFRRVLAIDPENERAVAGLESVQASARHQATLSEARAFAERGELERALAHLQRVLLEEPDHPQATALRQELEARKAQAELIQPTLTSKFKRPVTLEFRDAELKMVVEALSRTSGINILLEKDVKPDLRTTIFVKDASVEDAIDLILMQNQLEKKVLNENTVFVYPNTPAKTKEYQDLVIRAFHFTNADAKQMHTMIKTVLKTRDLFINEATNSLVMRDTPAAVRLAEKLVASQDLTTPEVMLEVEVLEVLRSKLTELGIKYPSQIGLSVTESPATTQTNYQQGTIVTTTTPATPLTLEALKHLDAGDVKVSPLSAFIDLRKEVGDSNLLASPRIRVQNREKAKILIGDRVPVITNSVTPVATGVPVVTGQVQYLDVGLKLEVEPEIHLDDEVKINTFLEVSSIAREVTNPTSGTVAYQIGTRTTSTVLRLKDGETQVLAGLINDEDRKKASKVPGLGDLPYIGRLFSSHQDDTRKTEIILSITPRIIRNNRRPDAEVTEFWSGTDTTPRVLPLTIKPVGLVKAVAAAEPSSPFVPPSRVPALRTATPFAPTAPVALQPGLATPAAAETPAGMPLVLSWQGVQQARVGDEFRMVLRARSGALVSSLPLTIGFDAMALEVVEVSEGDFLGQGGAPTNFSQEIDTGSGEIRLEGSRIAPGGAPAGATGEGSLATVTFRVLAERPRTQITVAAPTLEDAGGAPLAVTLPPPHGMSLTP